MNTELTFNTAGDGYWSEVRKAVGIVTMSLGYVADDKEFGELRIYFDVSTWDVTKDGLIYTDRQFEREMRDYLTVQDLAGDDVCYSEQGMQGDDYVSCDVGKRFLDAWAAKFGQESVNALACQ